MSYPNVSNYIHTNKVNIEELKLDIIESAKTAISDERFQVVENLTQNVTRAMGDFWFSVDGTIPAGGLPHLGHLVSRALYQDFYIWLEGNKILLTDAEWLAYANTHGGCCPYYSSGDGSTTFRTPSYPDTFLKVVNDMNGASVYQREGLPNITGSTGPLDDMSAGTSGAMYYAYGQAYDATSSGSGSGWVLGFDASRSNAIYGASSHVTPKNISMLIGVYAIGAIVPVGATDAEKIMNELVRINTIPHIVDTYTSGTSWYRRYSDGWIEQGGIWTTSNTTLSFNIAFSNTNYTIVGSENQGDDNARAIKFNRNNATTTSIRMVGSANPIGVCWYACGY